MAKTQAVATSLVIAVIAGCLISLMSFGVRSSFGLFVEPWSSNNGQGREVFALAFAIQNLCWGIAQPFAGAIADRFGPWRVVAAGTLTYGLGTILTAYATSPLGLYLTAGIMVGLAMGGASFVTVIGVLGKITPPEQRSWVLGTGTAAGSLGQFLIAPLGQVFIDSYGWSTAFVVLGLMMTSSVVLALAFRDAKPSAASASEQDLGLTITLGAAFGHASYVLLFFGFFVCGFQLAFILTHLPPYTTALGISSTIAAWGIGIIGLFNIFGAYLAGVLGAKYSKRRLLSSLYLLRAISFAIFILLPPTTFSLFFFCASMGVLWLSTVPLTSGLVVTMFGTRYLATLFGVIFFGHQVGSFVGAWLGGIAFSLTGDYTLMWWLSILLSLLAAVLHMPIKERVVPRFASASA